MQAARFSFVNQLEGSNVERGILDHRYELLEHIGGGGMADVYKAHDAILDRMVAVKILHAQLAGDEEFLEKFRLEAKGEAIVSKHCWYI